MPPPYDELDLMNARLGGALEMVDHLVPLYNARVNRDWNWAAMVVTAGVSFVLGMLVNTLLWTHLPWG